MHTRTHAHMHTCTHTHTHTHTRTCTRAHTHTCTHTHTHTQIHTHTHSDASPSGSLTPCGRGVLRSAGAEPPARNFTPNYTHRTNYTQSAHSIQPGAAPAAGGSAYRG